MNYAICNELFEGWEHRHICRRAAGLGYRGLEIAPFTLAPRITDVPRGRRAELRRQAEDEGVPIIGLHWLLARTEGFHVTSTEESVRRATADYLIELGRACHDLGGSLMVLGSPAQRRIPPGATRDQAFAFAADTLRRAMPALADYGVRLCLEPLAAEETDFLNSCAESVRLMEMVDHPDCRLHLDVKAMCSEPTPLPELIRRHGPQAGHFHANDPNRRGPGFGAVDFTPIFLELLRVGYAGFVSVEVFDYSPDPETIARESIRYMKACAAQAAQLLSKEQGNV